MHADAEYFDSPARFQVRAEIDEFTRVWPRRLRDVLRKSLDAGKTDAFSNV